MQKKTKNNKLYVDEGFKISTRREKGETREKIKKNAAALYLHTTTGD
jgi:hypothetical protein